MLHSKNMSLLCQPRSNIHGGGGIGLFQLLLRISGMLCQPISRFFLLFICRYRLRGQPYVWTAFLSYGKNIAESDKSLLSSTAIWNRWSSYWSWCISPASQHSGSHRSLYATFGPLRLTCSSVAPASISAYFGCIVRLRGKSFAGHVLHLEL